MKILSIPYGSLCFTADIFRTSSVLLTMEIWDGVAKWLPLRSTNLAVSGSILGGSGHFLPRISSEQSGFIQDFFSTSHHGNMRPSGQVVNAQVNKSGGLRFKPRREQFLFAKDSLKVSREFHIIYCIVFVFCVFCLVLEWSDLVWLVWRKGMQEKGGGTLF